ncbi:MAG TPA: DUF4082 domain-containing protein, partial [Jiangellales bacterium]|nr:DUF4082 domain-containing protein [Jiangellales bacterium]
MTGTTVVAASVGDRAADIYSFFANADVSNVPTDTDTNAVELGLGFASSNPGTVTAVRFLKARDDRSEHRV